MKKNSSLRPLNRDPPLVKKLDMMNIEGIKPLDPTPPKPETSLEVLKMFLENDTALNWPTITADTKKTVSKFAVAPARILSVFLSLADKYTRKRLKQKELDSGNHYASQLEQICWDQMRNDGVVKKKCK